MMQIVFVLWMAGLNFVTTKPLDQPAIPFNCGKIRCPRLGFYACVGADIGEPACYPCKMKLGTCGTVDEFPGCNLYCEDQIIKRHERVVQGIAQGYNRTNLEQSLQIDQLSNQIKKLKQTILDQNVSNVQLSERGERFNSTINVQQLEIQKLRQENGGLNNTIQVRQKDIKNLRQENGGLNSTIQVQQVEIKNLRQENGELNNTLQVEHANIKDLKSDDVNCSQRDFACLLENWPVLMIFVFAFPFGVVIVAVIMGIKFYRARKNIFLKNKSLELGETNGSFSSIESTDDMPNEESRSPSNTIVHSDCYCEKTFKNMNPVDDKGDGDYKPARP